MIGIYNIDDNLKSELSKTIDIIDMKGNSDFPQLNGLVIDWVDNSHNDDFVAQAAIVDHYVRKSIPIVIYDRFMCITPKEHSWLKKFNVSFFEPAFNNRTNFEYLPQWSSLKLKGPDKLQFDLGYVGDLNRRVKLFEKYYRQVATLWPDTTVSFYAKDFKEVSKLDEWRSDGLYDSWDEDYDFRFTILIDTPQNINIGYLPDNLFKMMEYGVAPLCPVEQKYFQGMFRNLVITKPSQLNWFIRSFKNLRSAVIEEIYDNIKSDYPEFTIEYACDKIKGKLMI